MITRPWHLRPLAVRAAEHHVAAQSSSTTRRFPCHEVTRPCDASGCLLAGVVVPVECDVELSRQFFYDFRRAFIAHSLLAVLADSRANGGKKLPVLHYGIQRVRLPSLQRGLSAAEKVRKGPAACAADSKHLQRKVGVEEKRRRRALRDGTTRGTPALGNATTRCLRRRWRCRRHTCVGCYSLSLREGQCNATYMQVRLPSGEAMTVYLNHMVTTKHETATKDGYVTRGCVRSPCHPFIGGRSHVNADDTAGTSWAESRTT